MSSTPREKLDKPTRLILASASPRRLALLREHGYEVQVLAPPLEEPTCLRGTLSPEEQAEAVSYFKAGSVATRIDEGTILAGDTIVAVEGRIFGKPDDRDDARRILTALSGTTHRVITGVTLLDAAGASTAACTGRKRLIRHDSTLVTMRGLEPEEIEGYLDTGAWQGKAGAYGIQDRGDAFVDRIEGSFTNVVGLPMELLTLMLEEWGA